MIALEVSFDSAVVEEMLEALTARIVGFHEPMRTEFVGWEAEDLNRRDPEANVTAPLQVETMIRQRRGRKMAARSGGRRVVARARPILRPELKDKLGERMRALLEREVKWRV